MGARTATVTPRPKPRSWFVVLVLALTLALVVGVGPAALAAPNAPSVGKKATQPPTTPSAASDAPSNAIPLLLAGIVFLALLTPSPRFRSGSGYGQY